MATATRPGSPNGSPSSTAATTPAIAAAARKLPLAGGKASDRDKALAYFETNAERMRYVRFRERGIFVGSGVVDAGCKAIGQRLKSSGMRWSVRGAAGIAALHCQEASGRWDEIWKRLRNKTTVATSA